MGCASEKFSTFYFETWTKVCFVLFVLDIVYQVRRVMLNTGRFVYCIWISLDPQYSTNYSPSHVDMVCSRPQSAANISANDSILVCLPLVTVLFAGIFTDGYEH